MPGMILPFPTPTSGLHRPETLSFEVLHLDMAALWLEDHGWRARAGVYHTRRNKEVAGLSTDATATEVDLAVQIAHSQLCESYREEFGIGASEFPLLETCKPLPTSTARSEFATGRVFGYG